MKKILIVGAGIGGLSTATELAKSGLEVTVLEAHIDPGGCAASFFHKGYRFDAGATLAGGFAPHAPLDYLGKRFEIDWQARPVSAAMQVHLPDGRQVTRWSDPERWLQERQSIFGVSAESFWDWQENTADKLWQLASQLPPWPPQSIPDFYTLGRIGLRWLNKQPINGYAQIILAATHALNKYLPREVEPLRQYLDAQLLISAQTTSQFANALYSAVALDLARQGVAHLPGGLGSIADNLVTVLRRYGGRVLFRQTVTGVTPVNNKQFQIVTQRGEIFHADAVIFNLPPWNIKSLLGETAPKRIRQLPIQPAEGWGAFMVYAGIPNEIIPVNLPLHQQIILREPLGEGNSIFLSISPAWDTARAPQGYRAITISTHTNLVPWWQLHGQDRVAYEARKATYTQNMLTASERVLPGFSANADLILSGTPVTFQRFTRRVWGWVGGFPQTSLFKTWGPRLAPGLWMVGDSIFPGQSVPAVALGGLRVAQELLATQQKSRSYIKFWPKILHRVENNL